MPEQTTPPAEEVQTEPAAETTTGSSLITKIKVLAFVVAIISFECVIAYFYLPSAAETEAMASAAMGTAVNDEAVQEEEIDLIYQMEVDLGEFSVTSYQPSSNSTMRIDFHLYGTISKDDEQEWNILFMENQHRFREQVIVTLRSADLTDLTDAGLGLIKRKISENSNKILGKPLLRSIIFSDFSFIEQ